MLPKVLADTRWKPQNKKGETFCTKKDFHAYLTTTRHHTAQLRIPPSLLMWKVLTNTLAKRSLDGFPWMKWENPWPEVVWVSEPPPRVPAVWGNSVNIHLAELARQSRHCKEKQFPIKIITAHKTAHYKERQNVSRRVLTHALWFAITINYRFLVCWCGAQAEILAGKPFISLLCTRK